VFNRMIESAARRIDWHAAACRDSDPEAFFPVGDGQYAGAQVAAAKAVCARCPLGGQCLDWALTAGIGEGIWGGHTEQERRKLRRARALR
jgi:WhiB family redox-sensing transcriptional regulator